ncbi:hypothetical protein VD0004_g4850 [Verticillium dahliae]|uniref:Chloride channel protein n=1 Tax=Verticillium dahliae TaxID=27337 RepID=A0A444S0G6_VERDA|nr:hypothetical protein VD0004_g4850 [Verticillium dahliae]PNH72804.1 hypothetical protein VD0001_g4754 [Verticillium dahliae]RXG46834.1 hypothetical protein VDGE_06358 [Verticillium dahliae]
MAGPYGNNTAASSSSRSPDRTAQPQSNPDDSDELDDLFDDGNDDDRHVLAQDPIQASLEGPISFKRKQKQGIFSAPARFLSSLTGRPGNDTANATPRSTTPRPSFMLDGFASTGADEDVREAFNRPAKDASPTDWYHEGPGRRVGYEDMTAIDWIFEYTKERQRLRVLHSSAHGLMGLFRRFADASQVWLILILTGLAVGTVAAGIDVTTDWLGDLKTGYCSSGPEGGAFHLNKAFCCWGYDESSKCAGWTPWAKALGVASKGGAWIIEYIVFLIFSVFLAFSAAVLVQEYGIYARHSGIPEIKTVLGGFVIRRFLGGWTLVTKSLGLCLAVASGMWLGKEGPLVHVACCCANLFIKLFSNINDNEARKREVLSAAAASGISVAFGSPIGGVLFCLEQISYYFPDKTMWQSFVCAMTAAVMLQALDPFRTGKLVLYEAEVSTEWTDFEIIPYAILGIIGGIYGGLFIKANMAVARWKKRSTWLPGPIVQVIAVALLTALVNFPNFYMKIQSSELVSNLFVECGKHSEDKIGLCKTGAASASTIVLLLFAAILGFLLAAITFGLQLPAGIILPSMAIGALTGRAVGIIMEIWVKNHPNFFAFGSCAPDIPCITPATYAVVGAAATLAGVTRMTVSIVVIMFELTGALTYVLPMMVAVMISKWVGDAFSRRGIYESWIHFSEYPFLDNSDAETAQIPDIPAAQVMTRIEDLVVLTATGHTIASLTAILDANPHRGFPVISDPREAILLGYISRAELSYNLRSSAQPPRSLPPETEAFFTHQPMADPSATLDLRPWMDQTPITLPSRANLHLVVSYFQKLGLRYVLFADRGVLQGLLTKKDVWYVLNGADETRRTAGTSGRDGTVETGIAREDGDGEAQGLLRERSGSEAMSPAHERGPML